MQTLPLLLLSAGRSSRLGLPFIDGAPGALVKSLVPVVGYLLMAPLFLWFFRETWKQLDAEAVDHRMEIRLSGGFDARPWVVFAIAAVVLSLQEYYGGNRFYGAFVRPWLIQIEKGQAELPFGLGGFVDTRYYGSLYGYAWWAFTRVFGYTVLPLLTWKLIFPKDSLLDMGLRFRGIKEHAWIYVVFLVVILPTVYFVAQSPEFASYYPFYKLSSRSWFDLLVWEVMYISQFFALEVFFRGFMLVPLRRSLGSSAIFAMCLPYVMIHFGKPYLETTGAFLAGMALGSLSMRTRSIYLGFLLHCTVALLMDALALTYGKGLPTVFWPR
jgi:membrane protease YdiL (CAAX protease family)